MSTATDTDTARGKPFLTAAWHDLVVVTWAVDPALLKPYLPAGCAIDFWEGRAILSLVAFDFRDVRVMGFSIPFHKRFPEVNLRFHVKRAMPDGSVRRGVSFIQEMVPRFAVAAAARMMYGEPYVARPMRSVTVAGGPSGDTGDGPRKSLVYEWKRHQEWERVIALTTSPFRLPRPGSLEDYVVTQEWGYTRRSTRSTREYRVTHPRWSVSLNAECMLEADIATLFGRRFVTPLDTPPVSTFVADGSPIAVFHGHSIESP